MYFYFHTTHFYYKIKQFQEYINVVYYCTNGIVNMKLEKVLDFYFSKCIRTSA